MKTNMGPSDRITRIVMALALFILYFAGSLKGSWWVLMPLVASILMVSSITGVSLLYTAFGINTKRRGNQSA